jgi:hypothetical protein
MSSPSKRALEFLAEDVREEEAELAELNAQIADLEAKREAKAFKLESMKRALGPSALVEVPVPREEPSRVTEPPQVIEGGHGAFRSAIRAVLRDATRGMRTRDVFNALQARGAMANYSGKADPVIRTSTELYRMTKVGQIKKRGKLYYAQETAQTQ